MAGHNDMNGMAAVLTMLGVMVAVASVPTALLGEWTRGSVLLNIGLVACGLGVFIDNRTR